MIRKRLLHKSLSILTAMKQTDKRFWIAWVALAALMVAVMAHCNWN